MEIANRKSISDQLKKYTYSRSDSDFIEVTDWVNGEGIDIVIQTTTSSKFISLSYGELEAINYLSKSLDLNMTSNS